MSPAAHPWWPRILLAAAAVTAAGAGGYWARGFFVPDSTLIALHAPAAVTAAAAGVRVRPTAPDTLPDIAFPDRRGRLRRLSDWKGRPLLVNFWAPWCAPCREEIPLLERLSRAPPDRLQVIGVAVDSRAPVLRYARHARIRYPLLIGEHRGLETIRALGLQAAFPFSVFVDARGHIVAVKIGILRKPVVRLILKRIDALDRGRIDLSTARAQISAGVQQLAVARATGS